MAAVRRSGDRETRCAMPESCWQPTGIAARGNRKVPTVIGLGGHKFFVLDEFDHLTGRAIHQPKALRNERPKTQADPPEGAHWQSREACPQ